MMPTKSSSVSGESLGFRKFSERIGAEARIEFRLDRTLSPSPCRRHLLLPPSGNFRCPENGCEPRWVHLLSQCSDGVDKTVRNVAVSWRAQHSSHVHRDNWRPAGESLPTAGFCQIAPRTFPCLFDGPAQRRWSMESITLEARRALADYFDGSALGQSLVRQADFECRHVASQVDKVDQSVDPAERPSAAAENDQIPPRAAKASTSGLIQPPLRQGLANSVQSANGLDRRNRIRSTRVLNSSRYREGAMRQRKLQVFIGSSTEGSKIAGSIESALLGTGNCEPHHWKKGFFELGDTTIEALEEKLDDFDFAILTLTADDRVRTRGREAFAPRDNLIFELGLFIGQIGRIRTLIVCEPELKLPTDILGITVATLEDSGPELGAAWNLIESRIRNEGPRMRGRDVRDLWNLNEEQDVSFVLSTSAVVHTGKYWRETTGKGQAEGVVKARESLSKGYLNLAPHLQMASEFPARDLKHNLILLGSRKTNYWTGKFLYELNKIFRANVRYLPKRKGGRLVRIDSVADRETNLARVFEEGHRTDVRLSEGRCRVILKDHEDDHKTFYERCPKAYYTRFSPPLRDADNSLLKIKSAGQSTAISRRYCGEWDGYDEFAIVRTLRKSVKDGDNDDRSFSTEYKRDRMSKDFGLIVRFPNFFSDRQTTIHLLAGNHTLGTAAAVEYFTTRDPTHAKEISDRSKALVAIVECEVHEGKSYPPRLVDGEWYEIDTKKFMW